MNKDQKKSSTTPIVTGTAAGVLLGAAFGPVGALVGVAIGAGLGFWFDKKESYFINHPEARGRSHRGPVKNTLIH